jgi:small nuclear ribonucleoprotein (snRNP)-like protein
MASTTDETKRGATASGNKTKRGGGGDGLNNLAPLLRFMEGLDIAVELKNGRIMKGELNQADHQMNLVLERAKLVSTNREIPQNPNISDSRSFPHDASGKLESDASHEQGVDLERQGQGQIELSSNRGNFSSCNTFASSPSRNKIQLDPEEYDLIHIRGTRVRYIFFPDGADIPSLIKSGQSREKAATDRYQRGKRKIRSSVT